MKIVRQLARCDGSFNRFLTQVVGPLIVLTLSASSRLIRYFAPRVSPFRPVRVTMP
jgi:hypothetical protein